VPVGLVVVVGTHRALHGGDEGGARETLEQEVLDRAVLVDERRVERDADLFGKSTAIDQRAEFSVREGHLKGFEATLASNPAQCYKLGWICA
jgi:hypothetical protein